MNITRTSCIRKRNSSYAKNRGIGKTIRESPLKRKFRAKGDGESPCFLAKDPEGDEDKNGGEPLKGRGIFSKPTLLIALYIIISASFMLQVMRFLEHRIGKNGLMTLVGLMLAIPGLVFLIYAVIDGIRGKNFDPARFFVQVMVLSMIIVLAWQITNYAERIHIAEFVVLGWFAARDIIKTKKGARGAVLACLFCAGVGLLDEIFQAILPYRFFDLNDIISNTLGGGWGTVLYLTTSKRKGII